MSSYPDGKIQTVIPAHVKARAKQVAKKRGMSLTAYITQCLIEGIMAQDKIDAAMSREVTRCHAMSRDATKG